MTDLMLFFQNHNFLQTEKSKDIVTSPHRYSDVNWIRYGWIGKMLIYTIIIECYVNLVMHVTTTNNDNDNKYSNRI